jgi:hypothetical protein
MNITGRTGGKEPMTNTYQPTCADCRLHIAENERLKQELAETSAIAESNYSTLEAQNTSLREQLASSYSFDKDTRHVAFGGVDLGEIGDVFKKAKEVVSLREQLANCENKLPKLNHWDQTNKQLEAKLAEAQKAVLDPKYIEHLQKKIDEYCQELIDQSDVVEQLTAKLKIATEALIWIILHSGAFTEYGPAIHDRAKDALQKITGEKTGKELDKESG